MEGVDVFFINRTKQPNHVSKLDFVSKNKVQITVNPLTEHCQLLTYDKNFITLNCWVGFFCQNCSLTVYDYTNENW